MFSSKPNYKLINLTALMLLLYIAFANVSLWWGVFTAIVKVLAPFIIAFVVAYALHPLVKWLEKRKLPHWLAVTLVTLGVVLLIVFTITVTLPVLYEQLSSFSIMLVEAIEDIATKLNLNLGSYEISISSYLEEATKNLGSIISNGAMAVLSASLGFLASFIISFIAAIYFLADMQKIRTGFRKFLSSYSKKWLKYFRLLDEEMGNYLHGLVIFMVIQFIEYALVFKIVGHPNWLLLGFLACITTVIPYFGGLITNIIAVITASVVSSFTFIGTIIICLIFPQLDGYIISPKIYGKTNNVNPLITIMVVSIGGTVAGVVGIIAALPIYLFLRCTYNFFKKDLHKSVVSFKKTID